MNKIEKYISLCDKVHTMIDQKQEIDKVLPLVNETNEIANSYRVEDLVSDFDSIGYKVDIKKLTEKLIEVKKYWKDNNIEFTTENIGYLLLRDFSREYEKRRGK